MDFYNTLFGVDDQGNKIVRKGNKQGGFITLEDGRVIFTGGPGAGGGGVAGGARPGTMKEPISVDGVSRRSRRLRGDSVNRARELSNRDVEHRKAGPTTDIYIAEHRDRQGRDWVARVNEVGTVSQARLMRYPERGSEQSPLTRDLGYFVSPVDALVAAERAIGL